MKHNIARTFFLIFLSIPFTCAESGEALFICFPDYPVDTDTFYGYTEYVGHAGVLLISDSGLTKYWEYGRYDKDKHGMVRRITIPNVVLDKNNLATPDSLKSILAKLSQKSGKGTRIRAAYFIEMNFEKMNQHAEILKSKNPKYDITDYNCGHFALDIIHKGHPNIDKPTIINPTPNNMVDEYIEEGNAEVNYNPGNNRIIIGKGDEFDAKYK